MQRSNLYKASKTLLTKLYIMNYLNELNGLKKRFGSYNINVIFASLRGYKEVRSYTTFKQVLNEVQNLLIE